MEVVAVLGASANENRYSYQAIKLLQECGHRPIPVSPKEDAILGHKVYKDLKELKEAGLVVDTLTMYVNEERSNKMSEEILALHPKRVIFNPGSENRALTQKLRASGIEVEEACTLVLLRTQQF